MPNEHGYGDSPQVRLRIAALSVACVALLVSCSLDDRSLALAAAGAGLGDSGTDGQGFGGSLGNGGSSAGTAGRAGEAGSDPQSPLIDGCADLDTNQVADCKETIVRNSNFEKDVAEWLAEMDASLSWDGKNASADLPSGSALVASPGVIDANGTGVALRAVQQCVPIDGTKLVIVYANAFVDPDQDEQGRAEVDVAFFDTEDCKGPLTTTFSTPQPLDGGAGSWLTLKAGSVSGATTKSAQVKLALLKPFRAPNFQARFDNILVKIEKAGP